MTRGNKYKSWGGMAKKSWRQRAKVKSQILEGWNTMDQKRAETAKKNAKWTKTRQKAENMGGVGGTEKTF